MTGNRRTFAPSVLPGFPRFRTTGFFFVLFFLSSMLGAEESKPTEGIPVSLRFTTGASWSHKVRFGLVRVTLSPQIAVWLEDDQGRYLGDVFVTEKAGRSKWGQVRRPEALPVWSWAKGKRYADGLLMPTRDDPLPDAVTGPTPSPKEVGGTVVVNARLPVGLGPGTYRLMVELNESFDFNEAHPKTAGDVNGQPSIVYALPLHLRDGATGRAAGGRSRDFLVGTGDPRGDSGRIRLGTSGLDSALHLITSIEVTFGED